MEQNNHKKSGTSRVEMQELPKIVSILEGSLLAYVNFLYFLLSLLNQILFECIQTTNQHRTHKLLRNLIKHFKSHPYKVLQNIGYSYTPSEFKQFITEQISENVVHLTITEENIPIINAGNFQKAAIFFTLKPCQPQRSFYANLAKLPLRLDSGHNLSGIVLMKNQVLYNLKISGNIFTLNKIYKEETFKSWNECFISIVEQSLMPECWVYTNAPAIEPLDDTTWQLLDYFIFQDNSLPMDSKNQVENEEVKCSKVSETIPEPKSSPRIGKDSKRNKNKNQIDHNKDDKTTGNGKVEKSLNVKIPGVKSPSKNTIDPSMFLINNIHKKENFNIVIRQKKNKSDSKPGREPVRSVNIHQSSEKSEEKPAEKAKKFEINVKGLDLSQKLWTCEKCKERNSFQINNCKCSHYNINLAYSLKVEFLNMCEKCGEPSLKDYCRSCLASVNEVEDPTYKSEIIEKDSTNPRRNSNYNRNQRSMSLQNKARLSQNSRKN